MVLKVELKKKPMDSDKKTQKYLQEPVLFFGDERLVVEDVDALALQPRLARRPRRRLGAAAAATSSSSSSSGVASAGLVDADRRETLGALLLLLQVHLQPPNLLLDKSNEQNIGIDLRVIEFIFPKT